MTGVFSQVADKLKERLRKVFESQAVSGQPKVYDSVRNLYKSCMDEAYIEENAANQVKDIMKELGGWPLLDGDKWTGTGFTWYQVAEKAGRLGFDTGTLLTITISTDDQDSTRRLIKLDQPSLGLDREYLIKGRKDKDVQAYFTYMVETAVFFDANRDQAEKELEEVLELELKVAAISRPNEERRNVTALYNPMPLSQLKTFWPGIDWVEHINQVLDHPNITVTGSEMVNLATPSYMRQAGEYLPAVSSRVLANYMLWCYIMSMMAFMDQKALDIKLKYDKVLTGRSQRTPRWETCVASTAGLDSYLYYLEGSLTNAVGAMYAKQYFPAKKKKVADKMVGQIRKEFKTMLDELDWMDAATKVKANEKVDKMAVHIAYAKEILDDKIISKFYTSLNLSSKSYLKNLQDLKKFINLYGVENLRKPVDKHSWTTHGGAAIVNAFYNPDENSIQFPAGILEGAFFQADRPRYMNYGAIGMIVGHEITHGFDYLGSQKDGEGNKK
jgi:membrane metallo-endopeptidase-like protein 1